jgi:type IV pilus assembly protein PilN
MIRINLLPAGEAQRAADRRQGKTLATLVLAGAVTIFALLHLIQHFQLSGAQRELEQLKQELLAIQGPYADATRIEQQKQDLQEKLRVIAELEAKKVGPVRLLEGVSDATPEKLWLTEFDGTGGTVKLSGIGVDEQTVADFLRRLSGSPYLRNVDLDETSQFDQEGAKLKKFVIRGQVYYGEKVPGRPTASAAPGSGGKVVAGAKR